MSEAAPAPPPPERWTVLSMIRWSADYLAAKGVEEARLDGEHLLAEALGLNRLQLYLQYDRPLTEEELGRFKPLLLRRAKREPLQYVLGRASFRELELVTDPRVLIPRPETEVLVQIVLDWCDERIASRGEVGERGRVAETMDDGEGGAKGWSGLDVGTGSGCIALSLALEGPFTRVVATDPSAEALEVAGINRDEHDLGETVELRRGALFEPLGRHERFDVVVSNPPYVAEATRSELAPEIVDWEPAGALFAEEDGLAVLRALVEGAPAHLVPGGLLALEVGAGQAGRVTRIVEAAGAYRDGRIHRDLSGRARIVTATAAPASPESTGPAADTTGER